MKKILILLTAVGIALSIGYSLGYQANNYQELDAEDWYNKYAEAYNETIDLEMENNSLQEIINPSEPVQSPII